MRRILVTGGAGFIGSNLVLQLMAEDDCRVTVLDKLTYAGNTDSLASVWKHPRFRFVHGDVCDRLLVRRLLRGTDQVIHLAAETHIDRSILDSDAFVNTDFVGTYTLLSEFQRNPRERFVQISTSEVYGSAQEVPMSEDHPLDCQSPYAATKLGAERLAYSYFRTYGLPVVILRPFNNYGPRQYPEKLIPFFILRVLEDRPLLVYGKGRNTRDWVFVEDCCRALRQSLVIEISRLRGQVINIGTGTDVSVLDIATAILDYFGKPRSMIRFIADRPGHVERLVADINKAKRMLAWLPKTELAMGIRQTITWYEQNRDWWQKIVCRPEYQLWCRRWYGELVRGTRWV